MKTERDKIIEVLMDQMDWKSEGQVSNVVDDILSIQQEEAKDERSKIKEQLIEQLNAHHSWYENDKVRDKGIELAIKLIKGLDEQTK